MSAQSIRFGNNQKDFYLTLKKRVDNYFKEKNISPYGNYTMIIKTIVMYAIYLSPFVLLLTQTFSSPWINILLIITMGVGMAGLGLAVMHDANHGGYSKNKKFNQLVSYTMTLIGGSSFNWKIQHNHLHHMYTNVEGHDEDIAPLGFLRFSPHAKHKKIHKLQFIYAWFFYGLMTLMWALTKDYQQIFRYRRMGLIKSDAEYKKELAKLFFSKLIYYAIFLVLPFMVTDYSVWQILLGFFILHFVCGLVLAVIFQLAHVIEETTFPLPDDAGQLENNWAIHQLYTTADFAGRNKLLTWYAGGLNYQVEHHLFPTICHIHYAKIAKIVKDTAQEFNLPYHSHPTFLVALRSHTKMLYNLGRA